MIAYASMLHSIYLDYCLQMALIFDIWKIYSMTSIQVNFHFTDDKKIEWYKVSTYSVYVLTDIIALDSRCNPPCFCFFQKVWCSPMKIGSRTLLTKISMKGGLICRTQEEFLTEIPSHRRIREAAVTTHYHPFQCSAWFETDVDKQFRTETGLLRRIS